MLQTYRTLVFDCDGVVLDSNRIKTDGFYHAARPYGEAAAQELKAHHVATGGISRYQKFRHFLDQIVPGKPGPDYDALLQSYADYVQTALRSCSIAPGLQALRAATPQANWLIVSGGDQQELRALFAARGIDALFDGGIFGSPDSKDTILAREMAQGTIRTPAVFLGDARYDHEAASRAGLDFLFVHGWSEFAGWPDYTRAHGLRSVPALEALL